MSCAKSAEPVKMLFGLWTQMGPRNHVLGGGPDPPQGKQQFFLGGEASPGLLRSIGSIWNEPKLFGRWQQQCGLSCQYCSHLFFAISSLGTASQNSATAFVTVTDRFAAFFLIGLLNGYRNKVVIF